MAFSRAETIQDALDKWIAELSAQKAVIDGALLDNPAHAMAAGWTAAQAGLASSLKALNFLRAKGRRESLQAQVSTATTELAAADAAIAAGP